MSRSLYSFFNVNTKDELHQKLMDQDLAEIDEVWNLRQFYILKSSIKKEKELEWE